MLIKTLSNKHTQSHRCNKSPILHYGCTKCLFRLRFTKKILRVLFDTDDKSFEHLLLWILLVGLQIRKRLLKWHKWATPRVYIFKYIGKKKCSLSMISKSFKQSLLHLHCKNGNGIVLLYFSQSYTHNEFNFIEAKHLCIDDYDYFWKIFQRKEQGPIKTGQNKLKTIQFGYKKVLIPTFIH